MQQLQPSPNFVKNHHLFSLGISQSEMAQNLVLAQAMRKKSDSLSLQIQGVSNELQHKESTYLRF